MIRQLVDQARPGLQIIVSDDASPHPFPEVEGVTVVRRETNGGFGANVNSAAAAATGDALLVLNSDLTIDRTFIADMVTASRRRPHAILSPRVIDEAGEEAWTGRRFPRARHQAAAWLTPLARWRDTLGHGIMRSVTTSEPAPPRAEVDWVVGAAMWIPLDEFRAIGGFDESFFMNSEEIDLQRRMRERGIRSVALSSPTVVHLGGGSSPSESRRRWLVDGQLLYADKWGSRRRLQTVLATATVANLAVNSVRRIGGTRCASGGNGAPRASDC